MGKESLFSYDASESGRKPCAVCGLRRIFGMLCLTCLSEKHIINNTLLNMDDFTLAGKEAVTAVKKNSLDRFLLVFVCFAFFCLLLSGVVYDQQTDI